MGLRTGYGTGSYGVYKYGLPQVITGQAVATATVTSTAVGKYVYGGQEYDDRLRDGYGTGRYGRGRYGQSTLDKGAGCALVSPPSSRRQTLRGYALSEPQALLRRLPLRAWAFAFSRGSQRLRRQLQQRYKVFTARQGRLQRRQPLRLISHTCALDHLRQQRLVLQRSHRKMRVINGSR